MILKIRKSERIEAIAALTVFVVLNALLIYNHYDRFTRGAHVGFWSLFYNHLNVSGYDVFSLIAISCMRVHWNTLRHPLFIAVLAPLYWLNHWLMPATEFNFSMFFMAAVLIVCDFYGFIFLRRTLHEIIGTSRADANWLSAMFYSFAHIMLATIVPDHFAISLMLLLLTVYVTGQHMRDGQRLAWWKAGLLYFVTAGTTLTNGVKTFIAAAFANGRKILSWRGIAAFALPTLLLGAAVVWQEKAIIEPQKRNIKHIEEAVAKKNPHATDKLKVHDEWVKRQNGEALTKNVPLLEWSDMTTSRWRSMTDNLFGESLQLHRDHLLEDVQQTRPVFVSYRWTVNYIIEAAIALLFVAGAWAARRERLFKMVASWFAFDIAMHLFFGFGLNEVYIMTAHWAFIIPISAAYLIKKSPQRRAKALRIAVGVLTLWLAAYNGSILFNYFVMQ